MITAYLNDTPNNYFLATYIILMTPDLMLKEYQYELRDISMNSRNDDMYAQFALYRFSIIPTAYPDGDLLYGAPIST